MPSYSFAQKYTDQISFSFKHFQKFVAEESLINLPSYLPFQEYVDASYVYVGLKREEGKPNFIIKFGLTENCFGENFCSLGTYYTEQLNQILSENMESLFHETAKKVNLDRNITGYYIPSECYAYCNEEKLVWFDKNQLHLIGTKFSSSNKSQINENLIKSANSIILK